MFLTNVFPSENVEVFTVNSFVGRAVEQIEGSGSGGRVERYLVSRGTIEGAWLSGREMVGSGFGIEGGAGMVGVGLTIPAKVVLAAILECVAVFEVG